MPPRAPTVGNKQFSESLFYMWRCVIALAHADGEVQAEEKAYLDKIIANLDRVYGLTPEQKKIFDHDMKTAQKLSDLLPHVKNPQDRASLVYFGDTVVWADGTLSAEEEALLKKLHDDQMSKLDINKLRTEIEVRQKAAEVAHAKDMKKMHADEQKKSATFAALDKLLLRFGIDILD